jgi:hypothetical protein
MTAPAPRILMTLVVMGAGLVDVLERVRGAVEFALLVLLPDVPKGNGIRFECGEDIGVFPLTSGRERCRAVCDRGARCDSAPVSRRRAHALVEDRFHAHFPSTARPARGSPHLRKALYMAAMGLYRRHTDLHRCYKKSRRKGRHHTCALVNVTHKLARIVWRMLTDNRPFRARPPSRAKRA